MISLAFFSLLKSNPDCTLNIIESILSSRWDLTKEQIAEAMEGCKRIWNQTDKTKPVETGIFSKLKLPSRLDNLKRGWRGNR